MQLKNTLTRTASSQAGFTLTEMLIVIALIALVGTFAVGQVMNRFNESKVKATKIQMKGLGTILDDFRRECGFYPLTDQTLEALITKPTGGRECKNYAPEGYIGGNSKRVPKDGFDNDFIYTSDGNKYELKSLGNDGQEGGAGIDKDINSNEIDG
jgi:general secretion pathway protein G